MSALFVLLASLPGGLTYRVSIPTGRAVEAARLPLVASALALTAGVLIALLLGNT